MIRSRSAQVQLGGNVVKHSLRVRMLVLVAVPVVTMLALIGSVASLQEQTRYAAATMARTDALVLTTQKLLGTVIDSETGTRGYVATGQPVFLDPYYDAQRAATDDVAAMRALARSDSTDVEAVEALVQSTYARLAYQSSQVARVREGHRDEAVRWLANGIGKRQMDAFRAQIASYERHKAAALAAETARLNELWHFGQVLLVAAIAAAAAIAFGLDAIFARTLVRRLRRLAENAERFGRGMPMLPAPGGRDEIAEVAQAFDRMAQERTARQGVLARYRLLSDVTHDIIVFTDRETLTIVEANAASERAYGRSRGELIGQHLSILRDSDEQITAELLALMDRESGVEFESVHRRADGTTFPVDVSARTAEIDGRPVILTTMRDITERQRAREQLIAALDQAHEASRLKGEFVATMSHEIRTPMSGVIGMSELLLRTELTADQREFAGTIRESARSLLAVLNDILDFSKIEAGKLVVEAVDFAPGSTVESVVSLLRPAAEAKGLRLHVTLSPQLPAVLRGDGGRLRQVLVNLIGNAVKFTEHGEVRVSARVAQVDDDGIVLQFAVVDTGIGIPSAALTGLFEPFVQADGTTTRRYGGTGLGLTISRRLVQLLGGDIEVTSSEGSGSTFAFTARFAAGSAIAIATPPAGSTLGELRVLVVDDDAAIGQMMRRYADAWGIEAVLATDVEQGLAELQRRIEEGSPFDVAVVDFVLPGRNGLEMAHAIRSNAVYGTPALVLTTAFDAEGRKEAAIRAGFDTYLRKPFGPSQLHDVLASLAETRRPAILATFEDPPVRPRTDFSRVLLAEDQVVNRRVAELQLKALGFAADAVTNGAEAVEAVKNGDYQVVLMDVHMPMMDGFAAARAIREHERSSGNHVTIIALTANALPRDRQACLAAGMDDYLTKPLELDSLLTVLNRWVPPREPAAA
jgi:PAS domain S-box-containing protein